LIFRKRNKYRTGLPGGSRRMAKGALARVISRSPCVAAHLAARPAQLSADRSPRHAARRRPAPCGPTPSVAAGAPVASLVTTDL
jgi:hypothetical protein